jgi:predicted nucleotidyltransferase
LSKRYEVRVIDYLKNYMDVAKKVKEAILEIEPKAKVYVFGSVVKGSYTGASDIDILVITDDISKKYEIMVRAYLATEAPVELHVVTKEMFERWYRRFIDESSLVEVP